MNIDQIAMCYTEMDTSRPELGSATLKCSGATVTAACSNVASATATPTRL